MRAALVAVSLVLAMATACSGGDGPARTGLAPSLLFPSGLLQSAAQVVVREYYAGPAACDATSGTVTGAGVPDAATTLSDIGCAGSAVWCGDMQVTTSGAARVFGAEADDASGTAVAFGCTQLIVDQPTEPLTITMVRVVVPSTCGDGIVQPTEQCDPPGAPGDLVCDSTCHTKEELVSAVNATSGVPAPGAATAGQRTVPAVVWPSGTGATSSRFIALWQDATDPPYTHVGMRVLGGDLDALPAGSAPALAGGSIWLTSTPYNDPFPSAPDANDQAFPAVAFAADATRTFAAFADDSSGSFEIVLRTLDASFSAEQADPIVLGDSGSAPGIQTRPAIALGANDVAYVVWQSAPQAGPGQIVGRTYDLAQQQLGAQTVLSSGTSNQTPAVAAVSNGWIVVWQSGSDIVMVPVAPGGQPSGASSIVSAGHSGLQDHPGVASIGGGDDRLAVTWADHGQNGADIVVQRFDASGNPIAGDSSTPINDTVTDGDQVTPSIAGSSSGAFFAVVWIDTTSQGVRARLLDASTGFDFNNVTGQDDEFQVSLSTSPARANPGAAVGGSGPFVAFTWEDQNPASPGIYARRFPLPP
jgi:hypothetical protein